MKNTNDQPGPIFTKSPMTAWHYQANLVPFPEGFSLAARYLGVYPIERLHSGFKALTGLYAAIYHAGVETPELLIPSNLSTRQKALKDADFIAYTRLLFASGIYGKVVENNGQVILEIEAQDILNFCARARIKEYEPFFIALEKFGLMYRPSQPLQIAFPSSPDLLLALVVFARACRSLTNKDTNPPPEFLRADLRLLQIARKKVRQVPLEPEEAIQALTDGNETAFARELDAWARAAGYVAQVRCTGVHKSEFNATYRLTKPALTLFGYRTENGHLHMHLNFNQTIRILPFIAQTPRPFRELYYERCACVDCGSCQDGPNQIELDGTVRRLCGYSYMNLPEVPAEHFDSIQFLLKVQDGILKEGAK